MKLKPNQSVTITGETVRKALAGKRSLADLRYEDTKIALLTDFLEHPHSAHPTIKPELLPENFKFKIIMVDELPAVATADPSAIYLLPKQNPVENDRYWEYIKTEPQHGHFAWERIGDAGIDPSGYATKEDATLHETELGYILGPDDGPNADKPLVPALALRKFPDPTIGGIASVLGWKEPTT